MGIEIFGIAVGLLLLLAVLDLVVGVSNDAVNFLNSSIGSKVAPRTVIMAVASVGIMVGVSFSSGMMEVARKGIFIPQKFTMPELLTIFLAVMLTDILLLDVFSTFGLPTSTTVSIVFELLGAAVGISIIKIMRSGLTLNALNEYINSGKALTIIAGILLSVIAAFIAGAIVQFVSRVIFTFNYKARVKRYGAIWGGVALTSILYFILVKGAKGAAFLSEDNLLWIKSHTSLILFCTFLGALASLRIIQYFNVNIFKPIILIGTFALAMAFAANDLVNFIGVPLAGLSAFRVAAESLDPMNIPMSALNAKVHSELHFLLIAGVIMVITLWLSKKARTVSETEMSLGNQDEGVERFESNALARGIVRMAISFFDVIRRILPRRIRSLLSERVNPDNRAPLNEGGPAFDWIRASVNLMVSSALISYATSQKLPLSTTYVTFMTAMGSSFADRAWGRDSAVYRVSGVITVVGGWFMTAILALTVSMVFACTIFYLQIPGVLLLIALAAAILWKNHSKHKARSLSKAEDQVFNLKKVTDVKNTIETTFQHLGILIKELRKSYSSTLKALFMQDNYALSLERKKTRKIQNWVNIITANVFKSFRLLQREDTQIAYKYPSICRRLQKLADGHRDIVARSLKHVSNHHSGLLDEQIDEIHQIQTALENIFLDVESMFCRQMEINECTVRQKDRELRELADQMHQNQLKRIQQGSSKTRLTILYYAIIGNSMMLSKQILKLLSSFEESFSEVSPSIDYDFE